MNSLAMRNRRSRRAGSRARMLGVTLIELMIVITIIGAMAVIAIPAYRGYAERAQRVYAKNALQLLLTNQENFRLQNNTYTADLAALGFPGGCTEYCVYTIDFTVAPDTRTFTARARPTAGGGTNGVNQNTDTDCQWFTIDALGRKAAGPGTRCWE